MPRRIWSTQTRLHVFVLFCGRLSASFVNYFLFVCFTGFLFVCLNFHLVEFFPPLERDKDKEHKVGWVGR